MISRRVFLGTGAVVAGGAAFLGVANATHTLDDAARALGVEPKPEPDPQDDRIVRRAARDLGALLATVRATADRHPDLELSRLEKIGREHVASVGGREAAPPTVPTSQGKAVEALERAYAAASRARAAEAQQAFSPDLTRVLASMAAGLAQCAAAAGSLR